MHFENLCKPAELETVYIETFNCLKNAEAVYVNKFE